MADRINCDSVAQDQILAFVQRIERIESEVKDLNSDKAEVFAEAKGNGFDVKALKIVISKRRMDLNERMELEAIVELYESALGMYVAPPQDEEDDRPHARARAHVETIEEFDADGVVTEPADADSNSQAERRPESTEQSAGANAEERAPVSSATIQPETADRDEPATAAVEPAGDLLREPVATEQGQTTREGDAPRETDRESGVASRPDSNSIGSAADPGEGIALSPDHIADAGKMVPTKLKMNAEFFEEPHPLCLNPDGPGGCGGNSKLGLCVKCKASAGIVAHGDIEQRESVH